MKRSREPEEALPEATPTGQSTEDHGRLNRSTSGSGEGDGDGDASQPAAKIAELDLSDNDNNRDINMRCSLPPHREPVVFSSYSAYETHYRDQHTNRCAECRKNFPSALFLSLHIEETHDSFAQARKERGERTVSPEISSPCHAIQLADLSRQYSCFVEGCDRKCSTPQKRKMHLIDKHMYPKNFFFAITRDGIDGRRSLLLEGSRRRRRSSTSTATRPGSSKGQGQKPPVATTEKPAGSTDSGPAPQNPGPKSPEQPPDQPPDQEMEDLSNAMSSLRFVPMSVRFGRGKKSGFARR
ncbi:hypothetical protein C8A00DRAFT_13118 [Chaetomidium leptoderma]|uniref:C2H2-type domain-containing protein n=1 Tax=Chaetomidium leptoderma TaxID=669021 RepID=A0AAN6VQG5_9PEZI|nr:hypothetical protein C8A00DRAFT_13118 [Chaetomidium leptoderma]